MVISRGFVWLVIGIFLLAAAFHAFFGYYFWGQDGFSIGNDDAFISYRYAQNLVEHGRLTFNPNEPQPVEGFSNPLLTGLAALTYPVSGHDGLYYVMACLGALSCAGAVVLVGRAVHRTESPALSAALMMTTAVCPSLWIVATSGLETSWVMLLQVIVWVQCLRYVDDGDAAALPSILLASGALVLLRTDGFVFPFLAVLWLVSRGKTRGAGLIVLTAIALSAAQVGARLWYYGLPLPLPTYVKVSGPIPERMEVAARLLGSIALLNGLLLPLVGLLVAGLAWLKRFFAIARRGKLPAISFELLVSTGLIGYYLCIGGDIYRERFLLILFPLCTLLLLRLIQRLAGVQAVRVAVLIVILGQVLPALLADPRLRYQFEMPKYDSWVALGKLLAVRHPGEVLATGAAGKLPYFSGLETIDMLGLNNRHIAFGKAKGDIPGHSKFDPGYIFSRRPGLICEHVFGEGSLAYGIDRDRYLAEGYALRYLVGARRAKVAPIRDVSKLGGAEIAALVDAGYNFGCVDRI